MKTHIRLGRNRRIIHPIPVSVLPPHPRDREVSVKSMQGMGDNIFQRPYIHTLCGLFETVYLDSPWPHLYLDMPQNLRLIPSFSRLRTQKKNTQKWTHMYSDPPQDRHMIGYRPHYNFKDGRSIFKFFNRIMPREGFFFHMEPPNEWGNDLPFDPTEPFCIVRNTTTRREWYVPNRNCRNEYLQYAASRYKELTGHNIIEIADIDGDVETLDGEHIQAADIRLVKGELNHPSLIWAFKNAAAVISCTGFALPLAQMVKANALIIFGGYDLPEWFTHPDQNCPDVITITPDKPCGCHKKNHNCNLAISERRLMKKVNELVGND